MKARILAILGAIVGLTVILALALVARVQDIDRYDAPDPRDGAISGGQVEVVGAVGGAVEAVAVQGNQAVVGQGYTLLILDIADPASPRLVGRTPPLPSMVRDVAVSGNHAYAVGGDRYHAGWLRVVDLADPADPTVVWDLDDEHSDVSGKGVAVLGDHVYVVGGLGLWVVDVSDPAAPHVMGRVRRSIWGSDVAAAEDRLYIASRGRLRVVDVSDPAHPTVMGSYQTPGPSAAGVAVASGELPGHTYAYVANWEKGLRVVDVSDPAEPVEVGAYQTPGWPRQIQDVCVMGHHAYIATGEGLRVIDVSDPDEPIEVGSHPTPGRAHSVAVTVAGGYACVADGDGGLQVVDVSDPAGPMGRGQYAVLSGARGVALASGDPPGHPYAYVTTGDPRGLGSSHSAANLWVVDVAKPDRPSVVGYTETHGRTVEVAAMPGGYLCLTGHDAGLSVVDVSTPASPREVGTCNVSGRNLAASGRYAYVGSEEVLWVVDISDSADPHPVTRHHVPGQIRGVAAGPGGEVIYLATDEGLRAIDVSDPSHPIDVGVCAECGMGDDAVVAPAGGYVYVTMWGDGLRVVDVSDRANPTEVGRGPANNGCGAEIALASDKVYVVGGWWKGWKSLLVVDVSDPTDPIEVGRHGHWQATGGVAARGCYAIVAADRAGLLVLRVAACEQAPPPEPSPAAQPTPDVCPGPALMLPLLLLVHAPGQTSAGKATNASATS